MLIGQLFEPNPMEKDLSYWDLYKGVTEYSMIHVSSSSWLITNFQAKFIKKRHIINLGIKLNNLEKEEIPKFSFLYHLLTCTIHSVQPAEI